MRLHDDELDVDVTLVRALLRDQCPAWAALPLAPVRSDGTVNALFRLGEDRCVRLPRTPRWVAELEREVHWLPALARAVTLPVPRPLFLGRPTSGFPLPWAVFDWIDGQPYADVLVTDEERAARDLAAFVTQLREVDPSGGPPGGRAPLADLDAVTCDSITASRAEIDADAALTAWSAALHAPVWTGPPVWMHGDLLRPNLLVRGGALAAAIDFGSAGVGDPAADVVAAWAVLGTGGRLVFRAALGVDDGTWERARGYALHQAAVIIPYYRRTNPGLAAAAVRTVQQVLLD